MQHNFYIQKGSERAKDIFVEWGIVVNAIRGLLELPEPTDLFSRNWAGEQGTDIYIPDKAIFAEKEVEMDVSYRGRQGIEQFNKFISYLIQPQDGQYNSEKRDGVFQLFSPYRSTGARLIYQGMSFTKEKYRKPCTGSDIILASLKFKCPNGLSFGISTYGRSSNDLRFHIKTGEHIDVYFSDGKRLMNQTATFTQKDVIFCIVNPSSLDAVIID